MSQESEKAAPPAGQRVYVLRSLDQARVLADALRVRILEAYGGEARTTMQLAEILGEKPSKPYHHVDALEKAELIRLEKTRQNRGTVEKYYRPVADLFKADSSLFTSDETEAPDAAMEELISVVLDGAADELRNLARAAGETSARTRRSSPACTSGARPGGSRRSRRRWRRSSRWPTTRRTIPVPGRTSRPTAA